MAKQADEKSLWADIDALVKAWMLRAHDIKLSVPASHTAPGVTGTMETLADELRGVLGDHKHLAPGSGEEAAE